jgi:hypothetical protein
MKILSALLVSLFVLGCHNEVEETCTSVTPSCPQRTLAFSGFKYCFVPNDCEYPQSFFDEQCKNLPQASILKHAVMCEFEPTPGVETDGRECVAALESVNCPHCYINDPSIKQVMMCCSDPK